MPHTAQLKDTAELIARYTKGEAEDWEWSTFEAVEAEAAPVEAVRQEVRQWQQNTPRATPMNGAPLRAWFNCG